jgi:serine/threonine protein kinase
VLCERKAMTTQPSRKEQSHKDSSSQKPSELTPERFGPPEIHPYEIELQQKIGQGSFGSVYKGRCRGKDVAIKVLNKPITDEKTLTAFKKEVAIMSTIFHPNICLFMGACTIPGNFFIVSEYLPKGDLEKMLRDPNVHLSLYTRMKMARDAALGMNWLHCSNPQFIHRDLKSSNLLVDENGRVKVCDFGLSQIKQVGKNLRDRDTAKGTPLWMAPEVMQFKEFNEKADVYSFGIVLWEILTRKEPFAHHNDFEVFRRAVCVENERPEIPPDTEPSLRQLIESCWVADPNRRPSFKQIIDQLDNIIVDVAVQDVGGRKFWKKNFLTREEVPWEEFVPALCDFLNIPKIDKTLIESPSRDPMILNFKCLKSLLAEKPKALAERDTAEVVNLEHFGRVLNYFGPLTDANHTVLDNIRELLRQPWFHGDISTDISKSKLANQPPGTFLIRFSSGVDGWFTLSFVTQHGAIRHQRIKHTPGGPYILCPENEEFKSLQDLVQDKNLTLPCPGSRFQLLFQETNPLEGYVGSTDSNEDKVDDIEKDNGDGKSKQVDNDVDENASRSTTTKS